MMLCNICCGVVTCLPLGYCRLMDFSFFCYFFCIQCFNHSYSFSAVYPNLAILGLSLTCHDKNLFWFLLPETFTQNVDVVLAPVVGSGV